ncbi:MAG: hypothetical protein U0414_23395 [Polyangiaceae bacterium]
MRGAAPRDARPTSLPSSSARAEVTPPVESAPAERVPAEIAFEVEAFARDRGGLVAGPVRVPHRSFQIKELPCFLFFVGGGTDGVARSAWVATLGAVSEFSPFSGRTERRLPGMRGTPEPPGEQVLIEPVADWPRAVRVLETAAIGSATAVALESLPARDQPAGLRGVLWIAEDITGGGGMRARRQDPASIEAPDAQRILSSGDPAHLLDAAKVPVPRFDAPEADAFIHGITTANALASALPPAGARVFETWDRALGRSFARLDRDTVGSSPHLSRALDALRDARCNRWGECASAGGGVVLERGGEGLQIASILLPAAPLAPAPESAPKPTPGDDAATFRALSPQRGALRSLARADVGGGRIVSVVSDDDGIYLLQDEGAFATVDPLLDVPAGATPSAQIVDLDGDGVSDVVAFEQLPATPEIPFAATTRSAAILRTNTLDRDAARDLFGAEVAMLGASDIDDAIARALAHARSPAITVTPSEACALLRRSTTPRRFAAAATTSARVFWFVAPGSPGYATRVVPAASVTGEDLSALPTLCAASTGDTAFQCRGDLCGNFDYALGSYVRFGREANKLLIDAVLIYGGS